MTELTKEWLLRTIAELEEVRDSMLGVVNEDAAMALAAMKLALASLEAEAVAFRSKLKPPSAIGSESWDYTDHRQPDAFELESCVIERLYTAPPAPVSVPEGALKMLLPDVEKSEFWFEHDGKILFEGVKFNNAVFEACRAAMLQGAENAESLHAVKASPLLHSSIKCTELLHANCRGESGGNSPVIPDGYALVPVEPTEDMIVNGFESEPDESFSDEKEWEAYDAMSGCQQAAHRAKLCWAAMIASAPKPEA